MRPAILLMTCLSLASGELRGQHLPHEKRFTTDPDTYPDPTAIWKVTNQQSGQHFYLAGSVHSLRKSDLPLPSPYYAAFANSEILVVEILREKSEVSQRDLQMWRRRNQDLLRFSGRETLESHLTPTTLLALKKKLGPSYRSKIRKTPLLLSFDSAFASPETIPGMDSYFRSLANQQRKPIRSLDGTAVGDLAIKTLDEVAHSFRTKIREQGMDAVVSDLLSETTEESLFGLYRTGDLSAMAAVLKERANTGNANLHRQVLGERNRAWVRKLLPMLSHQSPEVEFVLVGAAHLAGEEGLLELLGKSGLRCEQLYGIDRPTPRQL